MKLTPTQWDQLHSIFPDDTHSDWDGIYPESLLKILSLQGKAATHDNISLAMKEKAEKYDEYIKDSPHGGFCNVTVNYDLQQENKRLKELLATVEKDH